MAERDSVYRYDYDNGSGYRSDDAEMSKGKKRQRSVGSPQISMTNTEAKSGSVFAVILVSALAAALLGTVIYSLNRRNTMYNMVVQENEKLSLCEAENVRLQSELESRASAKNVEDYAENELGMQKIDSSQIKYIKIQTDDVVNIPEQDQSLIAKVESFFDRCVEYFRG